MKHTQGEWEVIRTVANNKLAVHSDDEIIDYICCVSEEDGMPSEANARLIAAAPDLLEALKLALPYLQNGYSIKAMNAKSMAEAAIAKATEQKEFV